LKNESNKNSTRVTVDFSNGGIDSIVEKTPSDKAGSVFFNCGSQSECVDTIVIN
jgi:hypothetical protein